MSYTLMHHGHLALVLEYCPSDGHGDGADGTIVNYRYIEWPEMHEPPGGLTPKHIVCGTCGVNVWHLLEQAAVVEAMG